MSSYTRPQGYPFVFLDAYKREDKDVFFGREEEIKELYEKVFQSDLLLLYGASGTGKTSLIQCGLANRFEAHDWLPVFVRRENNLNKSFSRRLDEELKKREGGQEETFWDESEFFADTAPKQAENPYVAQLTRLYADVFRPIYLIFDQFEELYTLGSREEQREFFGHIRAILAAKQPVKIIVSMREEYLGFLDEFEKEVPQLLDKKLRIEPMGITKVSEVIRGATAAGSLISLPEGELDAFAEAVFNTIKGEKRQLAIPLPYLQVLLDRLYSHLTGDSTHQSTATFSVQALKKLGNIENVMRAFLDDQVRDMQRKFKLKNEDNIWRLLGQLVTEDRTKAPRSTAELRDLLPELPSAALADWLRHLEQHRILRAEGEDENERVYEISHDALAASIDEHRSEEDIALMEVRRLISAQLKLEAQNREFLSEKQLNFVAPFEHKLRLSTTEKTFLQDSKAEVARKKAEAEREAQAARARKARRRRRTMWLVVSFSLNAVLLGAFGLYQASVATTAKEQAIQSAEIANTAAVKANLSLIEALKAKREQIEAEARSLEQRAKTLEILQKLEDADKLTALTRVKRDSSKLIADEIQRLQEQTNSLKTNTTSH